MGGTRAWLLAALTAAALTAAPAGSAEKKQDAAPAAKAQPPAAGKGQKEAPAGGAKDDPRDRGARDDPREQLKEAQQDFGLEAFKDPWKVFHFLMIIAGSVVLGALLAWHPFVYRRATLEDLDQPKIIVTYTVVGALVAIVVAHIPNMGFAIFGIGALMRFRTELGAAKETGRVILATVLGIACGLEFWMVAAVGTALAWLLIAALEYGEAYRMVVRGLGGDKVSRAADAYGEALLEKRCRFATPRKNPAKGQISFVMTVPRGLEREDVEAHCQEKVPADLRGTIDWPED